MGVPFDAFGGYFTSRSHALALDVFALFSTHPDATSVRANTRAEPASAAIDPQQGPSFEQ